MRFIKFYLVNLILLLIILGGGTYFVVTNFCDISKITVEGNTLYTDDEIKTMLIDGQYPKNAAYEWLWNLVYPKKNVEFVDGFSVNMTSLSTLNIVVTEKSWVGYLAMNDGEYVYFDGDGYVVEVSERLVSTGILVTGLDLEEAEIGQEVELSSGELSLLVQLLKAREKYELDFTSISFDSLGYATVDYGDIFICFGTIDNFESKIERMNIILPQLEGQKGTLHLETWTEDYTDIVFEIDED